MLSGLMVLVQFFATLLALVFTAWVARHFFQTELPFATMVAGSALFIACRAEHKRGLAKEVGNE